MRSPENASDRIRPEAARSPLRAELVEEEERSCRPWRAAPPPRRVLAIRLQAHGDTVITLPYLHALRQRHPTIELDFLTRREFAAIPSSLDLFARIHRLRGGRSRTALRLGAALLLPRLLARRYEAVLDLQRNGISRWLRRLIRPRAWSEFDRFAPRPAGDRTQEAIERLGLGESPPRWDLPLRDRRLGLDKLTQAGWRPEEEIVVLNPAGYWVTRQWPLERYVEFARLWRAARAPRSVRFLVMGLVPRLGEKARRLANELGDSLIDLVGRDTPAEAMAILARATLVVSEDSGLMHMAWTQGVPTVAIFGASHGQWARPLGPHSECFHSGDLDCGFCLRPECSRGDLHCLKRIHAEQVVDRAQALLARTTKSSSR